MGRTCSAGARVMIHSSIVSADILAVPADLITAAARCWRKARDESAPVQQRLYALLARYDRDMLAPVFASLMALCEAALGRRLRVGGATPSDDEHLVLGLIDGTLARRACIECAPGMGSALDCAICSLRIMMALAPENPAGHRMLPVCRAR